MSMLFADTWALLQRWLVHLRRDRMSLMLGIIQPLFLLTLAGPLLHHVVRDAGPVRAVMLERFGTDDYLTFLFSGVAVFTILVNSILGGIPIVFDRENGFMDKVLASPISRLAIPASRFLYVIFYSLLQVGIIGAVALLLGVNPGGTDGSALVAIAALVGYGALLCAGITVLSLALAFIFPHHSIFFAITGFMLSPLLVLSPTFVAREAMPGWMQTAALFNPMTHAIEPIRAAFLGQPHPGWQVSAAGLLVFDALCFALAVRVLRRRLES